MGGRKERIGTLSERRMLRPRAGWPGAAASRRLTPSLSESERSLAWKLPPFAFSATLSWQAMERVRGMEVLRQDDLERARRTPPEEKAKQAFALMRFGIKLQRSKLRQEFPGEPDEQLRQRLRRWMARDE